MQPSFVTRLNHEIEHPKCAKCGAPMWLVHIEGCDSDRDQCSFECQVCGKSETEIVNYR